MSGTEPVQARALWITEPGKAAYRNASVMQPGPQEVLIKAEYGALSRGTESLVFNGAVPPSEYERMRAPFQEGDFPAPVKYGYISVGRVMAGPDTLVGKPVFCLFPHQTDYTVPADRVAVLPDDLPPERAVLAANMETALNILWDARPLLGDRITVIGAGVLGLLVAYLARGIPGCDIEVVDLDQTKTAMAEALGLRLVGPDTASSERDILINTSAAGPALAQALTLARVEGLIVEASWYGSQPVTLPLGEAFHANRLRLISSQVGRVSPAKRDQTTYGDRMQMALSLLQDPALDCLFTHDVAFSELADRMAEFARPKPGVGCIRIRYD